MLYKAQGTVRDDNHTWVQSLATGERHHLVEGAEFATYSATGHLIYLQNGDLIAAPFNIEQLALQRPETMVISGSSGAVRQFAISQTGALVYAVGEPENARLVWVDRQTGAESPLEAPSGNYLHVHLSPSEELVLVDGPAGTGIFDQARGVLEPVIGAGGWAIWSNDGKRVTYARRQAETLYDIFDKAADGSGSEQILVERSGAQIPQSWSPDGQTLAFLSFDGGIGFLSRRAGSVAPEWPQTAAYESELQFSPDGRWIAYSSNETGRFEVYVRSVAGDVNRMITTAGGGGPLWSGDGRELFYRFGSGVYVVEVSTDDTFIYGRPTLLFEGIYRADTNGIASYAVSRDAQRFLMIKPGRSDDTPTHLNLVLNWFEELNRLVPTGGS